MEDSDQARADARFAARLEETGARDPREFYRGLLRDLKAHDAARYEELVEAWRTEVVAPLARGEGDPLSLWLDFGTRVAGALHVGRTVVIEQDGRSRPFAPPARHDQLILHLPEEPGVRAVPVGIPPEPSTAQRAALDLLVRGRTRLDDAG